MLPMLRISKLNQLCDDYGFEDVEDLLASAVCDSVCPGICVNPNCNYSTNVEPDCEQGWCEECGKQTVVSGMILAGVI